MKFHRKAIFLLVEGGVTLLLTGCFGPLAKRLADREVYPIIENKQVQALGETRPFTIDYEPDPLTEHILSSAGRASDEFTTDALKISLADMLTLSVRNSRRYQTEKENLYLSALILTESRREFSPIFTSMVTGAFSRDAVTDFTGSIEPVRTGSIDASLGMSWIFATGTQATLSLANTFVRSFGTSPDEIATGVVSGSIIQPLLAGNPLFGGSGFNGTLETLRQSERNVIYAVRDFTRFEENFIVERIDEYFRIIQALDSVANQEVNYENLRLERERSAALAEAGRVDIVQLDQGRQAELRSSNDLITVKTNFVQQLDTMKFNMGLPTDLNIQPDKQELENFVAEGLAPIEITSEEAIEIALNQRLDYKTLIMATVDAERRLGIVENELLPDLNLSASISLPDEGQNQPLSFDTRRRRYDAGLSLEIPLDRKIERNNYRRSFIAYERALRNQEQLHDEIIRQVRRAFQDFEEAQGTYDIQLVSLEVAERRVDSTKDLFQAGRVIIRDVLDAEESLLNVRNALTNSIVDYIIARLRLLVAIEGLKIDDQGLWSENIAAQSPEDAQESLGETAFQSN